MKANANGRGIANTNTRSTAAMARPIAAGLAALGIALGASACGSGATPMNTRPADGATASNASFASLVPEALYEQSFPHHDPLYTYAGLAAAAAAYPAFASEGTDEQRRREVAAFFANIAHETTGGGPALPGGLYAYGLYFKAEVGCDAGGCAGYCVDDATYPCAAGKGYYGRGPIQLSYNYNYGQAAKALGVDILANPDLVATDARVTFLTALWFWMTPQSPKPSAHAVMTGGWTPSAADLVKGRAAGFGMTIDVINGGVECGEPTPASTENRIEFYQRFATLLAVEPGPNVACATMAHY